MRLRLRVQRPAGVLPECRRHDSLGIDDSDLSDLSDLTGDENAQ
jgi:hypothetical protein